MTPSSKSASKLERFSAATEFVKVLSSGNCSVSAGDASQAEAETQRIVDVIEVRPRRISRRFHFLVSEPARDHLVWVDLFPIEDRAGLPPRTLISLRSAVASQNTLQSAVRWALGNGYRLLDVIDQDEFSRDVVFEMQSDQYLVYDAT